MTPGTGEPWAASVEAGREPGWENGRVYGPARRLPSAPAEVAQAAPAADPARPRFAQLTYTSFHRADGAGGWQVKDVSGGIGPDEEQPLVERATGVDVGKLPRFLSPDQIDALPRRLVYGPVHGTCAAYWHTVPAGTDSSGRPGNVFAHIVLDRRPATPTPALRPSDLLRSPSWLRPFSAENVLAADLRTVPDPPWPDGGCTRPAVLEFLVHRAVWRAGTLLGLLDAVHAAMQGAPNPMVVLGVEDTAHAEMWVAAVCHLMSPGTSRRLYFSTAERAGRLRAARAAGLHLVVVPCADLSEVDPADDSYVLISDEDDAVAFVEFNEADEHQAHRTRHGSHIAVTAWSTVAAVVLRDPAVADAVLARQDEIAAEVGDRNLECGWPLATAVVVSLQGRRTDEDDLEEAWPAAAALAARAPEGIERGGVLARTIRQLRERSLGRTPAEALAAFSTVRGTPDDRSFVLGVYLERALATRDWLVRPEGVPMPSWPGGRAPDDAAGGARGAVERVCALPADAPDPVADAVEALRVVDLLVRAGLDPVRARRGGGPDPVADVLDRLAGPLLLDAEAGPPLMQRVGPLAETTQARFVRPWVDDRLRATGAPVGCRLSPLLLRWLFTEPPEPPDPARLRDLPPTLLEAAAQATMVLRDPSRFRCAGVAATVGTASADLARTASGPALPIDDLEHLLARFGPDTLGPLLPRAVLAAPAGTALNTVVDRLRNADPQAAVGEAARQAAELRHLETTWFRFDNGDNPRDSAVRFVDELEDVLARTAPDDPTPLSEELLFSGMAADVVARIYRPDAPGAPPLVLRRSRRPAWEDERAVRRIARAVADAAHQGVAADLDVVLAAQTSVWQFAGVQLGHPWWAMFAQAGWTGPDGRTQRLLDEVARLRMKALWPEAKATCVKDTRDAIAGGLARPEYGIDTQQAMHDYDVFAERWWRSVGVVDERALAPVLGRRRR